MAPLTVELEINPLVEQYLDQRDANTSSKVWSLEGAQIKVDLCEVDAFLADRVYQMIRSSGLQFSFASFSTTMKVSFACREPDERPDLHAVRQELQSREDHLRHLRD